MPETITSLRPRYSADNRSDVMHLAFVVEMTPDDRQPAVAAAIVANDLMRGPWWFQIMAGFIRLRGNTAPRLTFALGRLPEVANDIIRATARHIRHGEDREEASSVGGLSQRETEIMVSIIRANVPKSESSNV